MEKTDKQFFLTFLGVTCILVLLTVAVLVAANLVGDFGSSAEKSTAQIRMAEERIQPIGKVNLTSSPAQVIPVAAAATAATASDQDPGSRVFNSTCQACHGTGAAGAPMVGDQAAWKPRIAQGIKVLYASALNGKGPIMLPKGGNSALSDAEVKAAVDYMVKRSSP